MVFLRWFFCWLFNSAWKSIVSGAWLEGNFSWRNWVDSVSSSKLIFLWQIKQDARLKFTGGYSSRVFKLILHCSSCSCSGLTRDPHQSRWIIRKPNLSWTWILDWKLRLKISELRCCMNSGETYVTITNEVVRRSRSCYWAARMSLNLDLIITETRTPWTGYGLPTRLTNSWPAHLVLARSHLGQDLESRVTA